MTCATNSLELGVGALRLVTFCLTTTRCLRCFLAIKVLFWPIFTIYETAARIVSSLSFCTLPHTAFRASCICLANDSKTYDGYIDEEHELKFYYFLIVEESNFLRSCKTLAGRGRSCGKRVLAKCYFAVSTKYWVCLFAWKGRMCVRKNSK